MKNPTPKLVGSKRKMGKEELQAHLMLGRRGRTFTDRRKEASRRACRTNNWR